MRPSCLSSYSQHLDWQVDGSGEARPPTAGMQARQGSTHQYPQQQSAALGLSIKQEDQKHETFVCVS